MCCSFSRKTLPHATSVSAATNGHGPVAVIKPAATSHKTVKSSLASYRNVKQPAGMLSSRQSVKSAVSDQNAQTRKPVSRQPISFKNVPSGVSAKTLSQDQPLPASRSTSVSRVTMVNQRQSVTSQFLKSATDRRRTVQLPDALAQPRSACDRRKSYQVQLLAKQKAARPISNTPTVSYTHLTLPTILRV